MKKCINGDRRYRGGGEGRGKERGGRGGEGMGVEMVNRVRNFTRPSCLVRLF